MNEYYISRRRTQAAKKIIQDAEVAPRRTHLYKRHGAREYAQDAVSALERAGQLLETAELDLNSSGYKGAGRGIHQAGLRVKDWLEKVRKELTDE